MSSFVNGFQEKDGKEVNSAELQSQQSNKKIRSQKTKTREKSVKVSLPSEGRQLFTKWQWSYPNKIPLKSKTFSIKYEKPLSTLDKMILNNFQNKYLYHAIDDILYLLKSKPKERDNLLAILYSPVLALQNNFFIDFFDIWIAEIYITTGSKDNKFLVNGNSNFETFSYITIKFVYSKKLPAKKVESFW